MNSRVGAMLAVCVLLGAQTVLAAEDEADLIQRLQSPQTTREQKDVICQALRIKGTAAAVPALAAMLTDEQLSQSARMALERMPFVEAGAALRNALGKTAGNTKAGIIDSLGERRDTQAFAAIAALLGDTDATVASSAALAVAKIGGPEALAALRAARGGSAPAVRPVITDAMLLCADKLLAGGDNNGASAIYREIYDGEATEHVRMAAYRGMVLTAGAEGVAMVVKALEGNDRAALMAALQLAGEIKGEAATRAFAGTLSKVEPPVQMALVQVLAQRGDRAAAADVTRSIASPDADVRLAAIAALGSVGDASSAMVLAQGAAKTSGAEQQAARQSLALLRGADVSAALVEALPKAPADVQAEIAAALGQRQDARAVGELLKLARSADGSTRLVAVKSLALLAKGNDVPELITLLVSAKDEAQRQAAEDALVAASGRGTPAACLPPLLAAMNGAEGPIRAALVRVAGRLGSPEALRVLRDRLNDADAAVREAALRTMANFAGPDASGDLLKLAGDSDRPIPQRVLAMRGYWRLVAAASERPMAERWRMCEAGMRAAERVEEKRLGLVEMSKLAHPDALRAAEALARDEAIGGEAEAAIVRIAMNLAGSDRDRAKMALQQVEKTTKNDAIRADARKALGSMDQNTGYITQWLVSGPYRQAGKQCRELFDIPFAPEVRGAEVKWRRLAPPADPALFWQADLLEVAGGEQCVVYVKTRVWSPREQKVRLEIGSDDGNRIWINGKVVHANNVMRPLQPDSDRAEAQLQSGYNDVMVKITQNNMGCGLCIRIRNLDGSAVEGLRVSAEDEGRTGR